MEATSQVILRNQRALGGGPLLLVDPPRDDLCARLSHAGIVVRASQADRGSYRWLQALGVAAEFAAVPKPAGDETHAILFSPREKDRLAMMLHALADGLPPAARLWLVGENRAGIKSAGRPLAQRFESVRSIDKARHCGLYEAADPKRAAPFDLASYASEWSASYRGHELRLCSLPGVFAHGRLDPGTAALLGALKALNPGGRVLDFACGSGVIGLALKSAEPGLELALSDSSALALEATRRSAGLNRLQAELIASDGLQEIEGRFDWIVSNLPFHRGVRDDYSVAAEFFARAGTFLNENGRIVVVFNRHLPFEAWIRSQFSGIRVLRREGEYVVVQAGRR